MVTKWSFVILLLLCLPAQGAGIARYSEYADMFELMDGISHGKGSAGRAYKEAWEKKFPIGGEFQDDLKRFGEIRKSLLVTKEGEEDLFGALSQGDDEFAKAFYHAKNFNQVLKHLLKIGIENGDVRFIASFFKKYDGQMKSFLKESTHFSVKLLELNKAWKYKKYDKALKRVEPFVLSKERRKKFKFSIRPVWWPKDQAPQIDFNGDVLILRYHPIAHTANWNLSVVFEKAIEALVHYQSVEQRENLTKGFRAKCPGRELEFRTALTTLFGVMLPKHYQNPKAFSAYGDYASSHFVDLYLKLLYPLMEQEMKKKGSYAGEFMDQAASMCRSLHRLSVIP